VWRLGRHEEVAVVEHGTSSLGRLPPVADGVDDATPVTRIVATRAVRGHESLNVRSRARIETFSFRSQE
jgi:hypothetical protein